MANVDPTFGVNEFNKAKILSETETYVNNVLMVLFGKPGFLPSMPDIGMDIRQYIYQFDDEINVEDIKTKLATQCSDFLPDIVDSSLDVYTQMYNGKPMLIFKLPVIIDNSDIAIAIGVTVNAQGEMVYNFVTGSTTQII